MTFQDGRENRSDLGLTPQAFTIPFPFLLFFSIPFVAQEKKEEKEEEEKKTSRFIPSLTLLSGCYAPPVATIGIHGD